MPGQAWSAHSDLVGGRAYALFRCQLPQELFGRMTGVFYVPLQQEGVGTHAEEESAQKVIAGKESFWDPTRDSSITSLALYQLSYPEPPGYVA